MKGMGKVFETLLKRALLIKRSLTASSLSQLQQNIQPHPEVLLLLLLSCFSRVRLCATPQMAGHQAPPSLGFSRKEHWSGLPFPPPIHESEK